MPIRVRTAWRISRAGDLARLERVEEPLPEPGPGQARLRVEAVGLNFADILACLGLYSATPSGPFTPGLECSGTVEALGPPAGSSAPPGPFAVGDRVCVLTRFGAYADALNFDLRYAIPVPEGWSAAEAAAWPVQGLTAWYGLVERARVGAGECVLVHSAAGGVGLQALSLLESIGARVIGTVGSTGKRDFLLERFGSHARPPTVIVRQPRRIAAQLDAALADAGATGFAVVFDAVLGPWFEPAFDRLAAEGRYVLFGAAEFMPPGRRPRYTSLIWRYLRRPRVDPLAMISLNRSLIAFNLIWLWERADRLPGACSELLRLHPDPPHVGAVLPFECAPDALRQLQSGGTIGKVVLTV